MSDENEVEILRLRVAELEGAIRRLAGQDATLSLLCKRDGSQVVTVTIDAALTDAERQAIKEAADDYEQNNGDPDCERIADTLHGLLDRLGGT